MKRSAAHQAIFRKRNAESDALSSCATGRYIVLRKFANAESDALLQQQSCCRGGQIILFQNIYILPSNIIFVNNVEY